MVGIPNGYVCVIERDGERVRERAEAAEVGERREKGTCAWEWLALPHSPVVFKVKKVYRVSSIFYNSIS